MKRSIAVFFSIAAIVSVASFQSLRAADPVPADKINHLIAIIKPQMGEEKWQEIPWLIDLWEARKKAAAEGKPILLWEMDGHPLGCT